MSFHTSVRQLFWVPLGIFASLTAAVAVVPALAQREEAAALPRAPVDPEVARGRAIYVSEGCSYCHTQQVRVDNRLRAEEGKPVPPIPQDARYGPASVAEDYAHEDAPLLGTERTGPDLMNVGDRIPSEAWHLVHLYNPRSVVKSSVMPAYPWYFHTRAERKAGEDKPVLLPEGWGGAEREVYATPDAQALVKYLLSLKPPRRSP
jgi:cytochrome c oxidase cbb3-type subunit 2